MPVEPVGLRELAQLRQGAPSQDEHVERRRRADQDALRRTIEERPAAGELPVADARRATLMVLGLDDSSNGWFEEERGSDPAADVDVELAVVRLLRAATR